jgi:ABC-type uncharacterized transport system permease subunit
MSHDDPRQPDKPATERSAVMTLHHRFKRADEAEAALRVGAIVMGAGFLANLMIAGDLLAQLPWPAVTALIVSLLLLLLIAAIDRSPKMLAVVCGIGVAMLPASLVILLGPVMLGSRSPTLNDVMLPFLFSPMALFGISGLRGYAALRRLRPG